MSGFINTKINKGAVFFFGFLSLFLTASFLVGVQSAEAHRSGCHRWHSCPSDSGSYSCGDAGHPCQYPTYPASGGVIYPESGYYKDCYTCAVKRVPTAAQGGIYSFLKSGSSGRDVKVLQLGLIKDGVYKEAIVSGQYGTLTEEAIKKFQVKYGIISYGSADTTGYGSFGQKTREKFNEIYGNAAVSSGLGGTVVTDRLNPSIPANASVYGTSWTCDYGYKLGADRISCITQ